MKRKTTFIVLAAVALAVLSLWRCGGTKDEPEEEGPLYLGLSDQARYVGMETCRECHGSIYETFIRTGMGQSFGPATRAKSAAGFDHATLTDRWHDLNYNAFWKEDSLFFREFRKNGKDTIHQRTEYVSYVVGSGQHTNSHIMNTGGYLTQMPMTYYTQQGRWDLPPGFEEGNNSRFDRKIGLECMTCHNGYPEMVQGSENKYLAVKNGIDCERCHGPGSLHVEQKKKGILVDVSKEIDYSIVNPGKLSSDLQFDVCQRCHLQGNVVLNEGKSFFDFRPGMRLNDVMHVFMARYENSEDEFIMASHADRLRQSRCFLETRKKGGDTEGSHLLTCVTCHNPHVSVKETGKEVFNAACSSCHGGMEAHVEQLGKNDCVSCHMPRSGSIDIPHVSITDHRIRVPKEKDDAAGKGSRGRFLGLACINSASVDRLTLAKAYLNHFEKFDPQPYLLDSAASLLKGKTTPENFNARVKYFFLSEKYDSLKKIVGSIDRNALDLWLSEKSWDNDDAWTAYRLGESFRLSPSSSRVAEDFQQALVYFKRAVALAPYNLDFRNKLGVTTLLTGDAMEAFRIFAEITVENPNYVSAYSNLGYLNLSRRDDPETAHRFYEKARLLNPDDPALLMNIAGLYIYQKKYGEAQKILREVLAKNPGYEQAAVVMESLRPLVDGK